MSILAIAALGGILYFGADTAWKGVKHATHTVGCMVKHGRKCLDK